RSFNTAEPCSDNKMSYRVPFRKSVPQPLKRPYHHILRKHVYEHHLKRVDSGIDNFAHFRVVNTGSGFLHSFNSAEPCSDSKMSSRVSFRKSSLAFLFIFML
ncbi:MAG: hypothetical protein ACK55Z_28720, partial [bacterium]